MKGEVKISLEDFEKLRLYEDAINSKKVIVKSTIYTYDCHGYNPTPQITWLVSDSETIIADQNKEYGKLYDETIKKDNLISGLNKKIAELLKSQELNRCSVGGNKKWYQFWK